MFFERNQKNILYINKIYRNNKSFDFVFFMFVEIIKQSMRRKGYLSQWF